MVSLAALWLAILLSAVIVFIASSVMHMLLPYHRSNYSQLPQEEKLMAAIRPAQLKPGLYTFPYCTHQNIKSPEVQEKFKLGPVGFMTIYPNGAPPIARFMAQWFLYCATVNFFVAYLAAHTVPSGMHFWGVFRVVGTAAFLAYGLGSVVNSIWKGQPWSMTGKEVIDGLVYAFLIAAVFGWLWPR